MIDQEQKKKMNEWLRRQFFYFHMKHGPCTTITLDHIGDGGKPQRFSSVMVGDRIEPDNGTVEEHVDIICRQLVVDAEAWDTPQRYRLQAIFKDSPEPTNRFMLRVSPTRAGGEDVVDLVEPEGATNKGIVTQMMRHNEALMKMTVMSSGQIMETQRRVIERQASQIDAMTDRQLQTVDVVEGLMSRKHERELESALAVRKQQAYGDITQKVLLLLPLLVNKISGKALLPEKTTSSEQIIKSLMDSLKPEQLQGIANQLTPEQQMALLQVYENMRKFDTPQQQLEEKNQQQGAE